MTNIYTVEVSLCRDCIFDVGHQCESRGCDTWKAMARRKSRQVRENMRAVRRDIWERQQRIQAGLKR